MEKTVSLTLDALYQLAEQALLANGFSPEHAAAIAKNVTAGERDGCTSHGIYRVLVCVHSLKSGKVSACAQPRIEHVSPSLLRADAGHAYSLLACQQALPTLIETTRKQGIAALAITQCFHFSALWMDIEPLTDAGLVALACTPSHAWVAPAGGKSPLFGTNPIAFGWPRLGRPPFLFDLATSQAARGDIELHHRAGLPLPEGWGIDAEGNPSTDPLSVMQGAMLTFGGYKGSALSAMVELLAGPLIGEMTSAESLAFDGGQGASPYGGELIIAIDPEVFLGGGMSQHLARAETLFNAMLQQGARLPGQRRYEQRKKSLAEGVSIPRSLYDEINKLCQPCPC